MEYKHLVILIISLLLVVLFLAVSSHMETSRVEVWSCRDYYGNSYEYLYRGEKNALLNHSPTLECSMEFLPAKDVWELRD